MCGTPAGVGWLTVADEEALDQFLRVVVAGYSLERDASKLTRRHVEHRRLVQQVARPVRHQREHAHRLRTAGDLQQAHRPGLVAPRALEQLLLEKLVSRAFGEGGAQLRRHHGRPQREARLPPQRVHHRIAAAGHHRP